MVRLSLLRFSRSFAVLFALLTMLLTASTALAGAAPESKFRFDWESSNTNDIATDFINQLSTSPGAAYNSGSQLLRDSRTLSAFTQDINDQQLNTVVSVDWTNGVLGKDGARLSGDATLASGKVVPIFASLLGDEHIDVTVRNYEFGSKTTWTVLDVQRTSSLFTRIQDGEQTTFDLLLGVFFIVIIGSLISMIGYYMKGLRGSPRELFLLYFTKLTEYSAYGAASYAFVLYLAEDVGIGFKAGAAYYTVFTLTMSIVVIIVGSLCDAIGIKKSLLIGSFMLLTARIFMPLSTNIVVVTLLGFLPMAIGTALTGPVLKVGIKKFTTVESATLGFGLFYTIMNIGFAIGGWMFDYVRQMFGESGGTTLPILGWDISTYQVIFLIGFFINIPDLIAILLMREGAEMTEDGAVINPPKKQDNSVIDGILSKDHVTRLNAMKKESLRGLIAFAVVATVAYQLNAAGFSAQENLWLWAGISMVGLSSGALALYGVLSLLATQALMANRLMYVVREAAETTARSLKENFANRHFQVYMGMLGVLVFVRLTFFIFHVAFPTYAIRYFGAGASVGNLFGVLNPVLIVFLVPLFSLLTKSVRSYTMLLIGTTVSAGAVFVCFIPESISIALTNTWFGELVYDRWLEVPFGHRDPFYIALILFIIIFTVGEAIWSPRLMQFSAEIAPRGKEGAYIALAILPYFLGKALAGGSAGPLVDKYTPEDLHVFPDHIYFWAWIGGMALLTPIGLVVFRKVFTRVEKQSRDDAISFTKGQEKPGAPA